MKKTLAFALILALLLGASPAYAGRMYFTSVDNNPTYDINELIANWIGYMEGWGTEYELDIGDLAAAATGRIEGVGDVESPQVPGVIPLRSYIVGTDGIARTFNVMVSNLEEDIFPKECLSSISSSDLDGTVEGFTELSNLLLPVDAPKLNQADIDAFAEKYNDHLVSIYTAVDFYMRSAGYDMKDYGDIGTLATALYVIMNYFPIGARLQEYLDNEEMGTEAVFLCAEMYKGFYATFVRDEVTMAEFSYVTYLWSLNTEEENKEGTPYALVAYSPDEQRWVLIDIFQVVLKGDKMQKDEILNVMIDTRYFLKDSFAENQGNASVVALRYNEATSSWQIAGMNRAAYFQLLENGISSPTAAMN